MPISAGVRLLLERPSVQRLPNLLLARLPSQGARRQRPPASDQKRGRLDLGYGRNAAEDLAGRALAQISARYGRGVEIVGAPHMTPYMVSTAP